MQSGSVTLGKPERHRDMLDTRRPLRMLREDSDTGPCAGTCLMLSRHSTVWRSARMFVGRYSPRHMVHMRHRTANGTVVTHGGAAHAPQPGCIPLALMTAA